MFAIYLGSLLFGAVLIAASAFGGADHGAEIHGGGDAGHGGDNAGHGDGAQNQGLAWVSLFGLRFWSFGSMFFGITGLVLRAIDWSALAPLVSTGVGVGAGLVASATFRQMTRESVGSGRRRGRARRTRREAAVAGRARTAREGAARAAGAAATSICWPSPRTRRSRPGAEVLIVEVRGNVAVVARAPAERPAPRS